LIEQDDIEDLDLAAFEFVDPFTPLSEDMWVNYKKLGSNKSNAGAGMMVRPRLSINDLHDMVALPEGIQSFQYAGMEFCASHERRRRVSEKLSSGRRMLIWRGMGARQIPNARLR